MHHCNTTYVRYEHRSSDQATQQSKDGRKSAFLYAFRALLRQHPGRASIQIVTASVRKHRLRAETRSAAPTWNPMNLRVETMRYQQHVTIVPLRWSAICIACPAQNDPTLKQVQLERLNHRSITCQNTRLTQTVHTFIIVGNSCEPVCHLFRMHFMKWQPEVFWWPTFLIRIGWPQNNKEEEHLYKQKSGDRVIRQNIHSKNSK